MTTHIDPGPRPRWYFPLVTGTPVVLAGLIVAASRVESDLGDTVLGILTGILTAGVGGLVLMTELDRRAAVSRREAAALDDLEPLRAASSTDYAARASADTKNTFTPTPTALDDDQPGVAETGR